ncbi:MAG TPA: DEAD/DEAH box helicase [Verrucomicrobiales bacterium]|nr:DEAD/DEAH box helicase [Verrucomicrobiales bacterium]
MSPLENQLNRLEGLNALTVPDIWQQEAVSALRQGRDVVLHAPTGAGKTLVFELWSNHGKNRGQAIYTVPTRALANDKLAEWRSKGWDIGIATGDLSENLDAPIIVATLETQKFRLIQGIGPTLLVVDEYQMIGDQDRGLNYELAIAMTPPTTQLLMMSGSVENAHHVVRWLNSLGRDAVLISHHHRPVPLEEFEPRDLSFQLPSSIKGLWPKMIAKVLAEDLGPILVFTPQRQAAEKMADALSRNLPNPHPLQLNARQQKLAGDRLSRILKSRIAFHHSGLSYEVRAGLIEPLSKAGQLRVVVATMGLATCGHPADDLARIADAFEGASCLGVDHLIEEGLGVALLQIDEGVDPGDVDTGKQFDDTEAVVLREARVPDHQAFHPAKDGAIQTIHAAMPVVVFWKDEVEVFRESCVVLAREAGERRCARNAAEQDVAIDAIDHHALFGAHAGGRVFDPKSATSRGHLR